MRKAALVACLFSVSCDQTTSPSTETEAEADTDTDTDTDSDTDTDTDTDTDAEPNGPEVLTFGSNVTVLTEGESVTFSAVVTDPDGIEDVIGGVLNAPEGTQYLAFSTAASEGSYTAILTWDAIHQVKDISFAEEESRDFIAVFYDQEGNTTSASVTLSLSCGGVSACSGVCVNLDTSEKHCGTCDQSCSRGTCDEGICTEYTSECASSIEYYYYSVSDYCETIGKTCSETCGGPIYVYWDDECESDDTARHLSGDCDDFIGDVYPSMFRACCL